MKIKSDIFTTEAKKATIAELKVLVGQPSDKQERPCPGCRFTTPDGKSGSGDTQFCSYSCPAAAREMSGDPDNFPIEQGIVPAVYAFYSLRALMPCWSCEGHLDGHGLISKLPRVWFYSGSNFYPKLIAQAIGKMETHNQLKNDWMIRVLPFSQSMYTITYSLEPADTAIIGAGSTVLDSLRSDVRVIADNLRTAVFAQAKDYIDKGNASPFKK